MKKKVVLLLMMSITCFAMLSACGRNKTENTDPLTGQEQTTEIATENVPLNESANNTQNNHEEFDRLLAQENNHNGIIDYINTNIVGALDTDVHRFFTGLLGYGENIRDIDFTRLEESRQHMPEDMVAFMELMKLEKESPSMVMSKEENRMTIGLTLSEMLERALLFEKHIEKYPNHASTEAATRLYEEIATHAITGGYDKTNGVAHYYQGETADVVDKEALSYYQQFAEANQDTRLGKVVQEYITLLQKNQFKINDEMESFYHGIHERLLPVANENQTGAAGANNSTANGTAGTNGTTNNTQNGTTNTTGTNAAGTNAGTANEGARSGGVQNATGNVMENNR